MPTAAPTTWEPRDAGRARDAVQEQVARIWARQFDALSRALSKQMQPALEAARRRDSGAAGERPRFDAPGLSRRVSYSGYVAKFRAHVSDMWEDYAQWAYAPPVDASFAEVLYEHRGMRGDEVMARMRDVAFNFPDPPTPPQWKIIDASFCAMGALIFGDEWQVDREAILRRHSWRDYYGILGVLTPRKFGKTTCLAYIVILVLFCISGAKVLVVSRTRGQVGDLFWFCFVCFTSTSEPPRACGSRETLRTSRRKRRDTWCFSPSCMACSTAPCCPRGSRRTTRAGQSRSTHRERAPSRSSRTAPGPSRSPRLLPVAIPNVSGETSLA